MEITLQRIISAMEDANIKQKDLLTALGLSEPTFSAWKSGRNTSYKKYIHAIAEYLNVSVEYLKGETEQKEKLPLEIEEKLLEMYELTKGFDESDMIALKAFVAGLKANRKQD